MWVLGVRGWGQIQAQAAVQVYVEDSPAAAELVAAAQDRRSKGELEEASRLLQTVLDVHGSKLLDSGSGRFTEARRLAQRVLTEHGELLAMYRQLHEPLAQRELETAGAERGALERLLRRMGLTDAGFTAGLRLAGLYLETGEAGEASIVLEELAEHPSLAQRRQEWLKLSGFAAVVGDDEAEQMRIRQEMTAAGWAEGAEQIAALDEAMRYEAAKGSFNGLDALPAAAAPESVKTPVWTRSLGGAEQFLIDTYRAERQQVDSLAEDGRYLNVVPLLSGGTMFLNDGQTVYAIEPSSGLELWRQTVSERSEDNNQFIQAYNRWLPNGADLSLLATGGDRVVAVCGFSAMITVYPYYRQEPDSTLACLDRQTGQIAWKRSPKEVDETLADGFWYGRPFISQGRVYCMIRLRQRTQFTDAWIVALDVQTGQTVWRRHLASTASDRQVTPSLSHIAMDGGWLYIDTRLGTVARVAASDGSIDWLTLVPINDQVPSPSTIRPWQATAPIVVGAGVVILDDWTSVIRVLDPATGSMQRTISASEWANPLHLYKSGDDVLAIGPTVIRLDGTTLEPKWRQRISATVRGRSALTADRLYVPQQADVAVIDLADGKIVEQLPIAPPVNLMALDGQLVAYQRSGLSSFSSWAVAARHLNQRIAARGDDPKPVMAMAWLAYRTGREAELLASLDRVAEMLKADRSDAESEDDGRLFDQIMAMAADRSLASAELRQKLFDRAAAVAVNADQEVAYRLAMAGVNQELARYAEAVEQYQAILSEPVYRRRLFNHESGSRQAALEAQRRLADLLKEHGRSLYDPYDAFAKRRLEELGQEAATEPLIELADAYPLSSVTVEALSLAAERLSEQQRVREAVAALRRAAQLTSDEVLLAKLYGRQAELLDGAGQPERARRVLRSLAAQHPQVRPVRDGVAVETGEWIGDLSRKMASRGAGNRLGLPLTGEPKSLDGFLLMPQFGSEVGADSVVLWSAEKLELRRGAELERVWEVEAKWDMVELLAADPSRVWLSIDEGREIRLVDAVTGQISWRDDKILERLAAINPPVQRPRNAAEAEFNQLIPAVRQNVVEEMGDALMMAMSDVAIAVSDGRGRVMVLGADSGKVAWQGATSVRQVTAMVLEPEHLVIAGTDEDDVPVVCVYDAMTGQLRHRLANPRRQLITWIGVNDQGQLVYVSPSQVEAFDLDRGQSTWIARPGAQLTGGDEVWMSGDGVMVRTEDNDLVLLSASDGRVVNQIPLRGMLQGELIVEAESEMWFVAGLGRCMAIDGQGKVVWRDAVSDPAQFVGMCLTEGHVLVSGAPADGQEGQVGFMTLYALNRTTGVMEHVTRIDSPQPLYQLRTAGGKLLLGGDDFTAVIRGQ
jgi:outer membrane protein assembly factor BamB